MAWALEAPSPALRAQAGAAKVEVATIHRNKEVEGARASAGPGAIIGPARFGVLPGGRLIAEGMSTMELIREGYGYVRRPANDVTGPDWLDLPDRSVCYRKMPRRPFAISSRIDSN
jgi:hypothetical protein